MVGLRVNNITWILLIFSFNHVVVIITIISVIIAIFDIHAVIF